MNIEILTDADAVARQRLQSCGVTRIYGGDFCTYTEADRFFSYRRARTSARMRWRVSCGRR